MTILTKIVSKQSRSTSCPYNSYSEYKDRKNKKNVSVVEEEIEEDFELKFMSYTEEVIDINNEPYLDAYKKHSADFIKDIVPEKILSDTSQQYTVFPTKYQKIWNNYKKQQEQNWVPNEIDLSKDIIDWENSSKNTRKFLMHVLAFFAASDGIVNCNIKKNIVDVIKIKEAECAYGKQFDMENVHGETYSILLDTYIQDSGLKNKLFNAIKSMESIKLKKDWCEKWINSDKPFAHKIVAFAIVEGIFFSGAFASIFWLKTKPGKKLAGLRKANRFIARDEALHFILASYIYELLDNKLKQSVIYEILKEAVEIEDKFINQSLPCKMLGMNANLMSQYIRYVADRFLVMFGYEKLYNVENPFDFMGKIDTFVKSNFFEERSDGYSDPKVNGDRDFCIFDFQSEWD
jgi:ribonucleoside-diphosphate reductase subunit M2